VKFISKSSAIHEKSNVEQSTVTVTVTVTLTVTVTVTLTLTVTMVINAKRANQQVWSLISRDAT